MDKVKIHDNANILSWRNLKNGQVCDLIDFGIACDGTIFFRVKNLAGKIVDVSEEHARLIVS